MFRSSSSKNNSSDREDSDNVNVVTRKDVLHIETAKVNYTFGEIPDANLDSKELINALVKHEFRTGSMKKDEPDYANAVNQLKKQLRNIKTDYSAFQIVIDKLDPEGSFELKEKVNKLYNRILFFQVDSLLLDFARYVFSYYAILQLKNIQSITKKFYSEQSNDVAAKQLNSLKFLEPNEDQIKSIISELDDRIEEHRKEVDDRREPKGNAQSSSTAATAATATAATATAATATAATTAATATAPKPNEETGVSGQIQQAAGNVDANSNPVKTLTDKFTEKQNKFIEQRKQFKSFVNMLLGLLSTSLDQVIKVHESFLDSAKLDDELKSNIKSIISKIEDGVYHLKSDESIDKDLEQIDSELVSQLGKRGTVRYKSILNDINQAVDDISKQNGVVSSMS